MGVVFELKKIPEIAINKNNEIWNIISDYKKIKIERYKNNSAAIQAYVGDLFVKYALIKEYGMNLSDIEIKTDKYGKPLLCNQEHIHFNLSHTKNKIVVAVDSEPIGIDVEFKQAVNQMNISRYYFTKKEMEKLAILDGRAALDYFFRLWVLKESFLKANGKGLYMSMKSIDFSTFELKCNNIMLDENWIRFYDSDSQYAMGVCSKNKIMQPPSITTFDKIARLLKKS